jgi:hypothetical protein
MQSGLQQQINQPPFPALAPALEDYLDKVLGYWQQSTSKIERYQCKFKRWQYDPTQVTQKLGEREQHYTQATGVIRYMTPDKGMFQIEELKFYKQQPDGSFQYQAVDGQFARKRKPRSILSHRKCKAPKSSIHRCRSSSASMQPS